MGKVGLEGEVLADEATAAVVAHSLLTSLAVIAGTSSVLRDGWHGLSGPDRASMLNKIEACAVEAAQHLRGIACGYPALARSRSSSLSG
jgi:hypothetical protein